MVVFRIIRNLYFMAWKLLILPLMLIRRFGFTIIVLGIVLYLGYSIFTVDDEPQTIGQASQQPSKPSEIQFVKRLEDGNSAFASDLVSQMNKEEIAQYSRLFYWVMDHKKDGDGYEWKYYNIHGTLTPTKSFRNKLGQTCRHFKEILKVHETQQDLKGIACQQRGGGWCKLRTNSTPACDLGRKKGVGTWWSDTKRSLGF